MINPPSGPALPKALLSANSTQHGVGCDLFTIGGVSAPVAWPAANRALYFPLYIDRPGIVTKFWTLNGATASGNIDIGLYGDFASGNFARMVSTGAVAQAGTSVIQEFDVTDFAILPGVYFLGLALSSGTGTIWSSAWQAQIIRGGILGITQEAAALPLPATATPAQVTTAFGVVVAGIAFRTLVA